MDKSDPKRAMYVDFYRAQTVGTWNSSYRKATRNPFYFCCEHPERPSGICSARGGWTVGNLWAYAVWKRLVSTYLVTYCDRVDLENSPPCVACSACRPTNCCLPPILGVGVLKKSSVSSQLQHVFFGASDKHIFMDTVRSR